MIEQVFTFILVGQVHVINLKPFGRDAEQIGVTERVEQCAAEMNRIQILLTESKFRHMLLKRDLLLAYVGKDTDAAKTRYLELNIEYISSRRTRDFLENAHKVMLYGHYPRLRDAEKHAHAMELSSAQVRHHRPV